MYQEMYRDAELDIHRAALQIAVSVALIRRATPRGDGVGVLPYISLGGMCRGKDPPFSFCPALKGPQFFTDLVSMGLTSITSTLISENHYCRLGPRAAAASDKY